MATKIITNKEINAMEEETCAENLGTTTNGKIAQIIPEIRTMMKIIAMKEMTIAGTSVNLNIENLT